MLGPGGELERVREDELADARVGEGRPLQGAVRERVKQLVAIRDATREVLRTQLQDAVPMTLGQEFSAFAVMLAEDEARLDEAAQLTREINLGATAIGTGINAHPDYAALARPYGAAGFTVESAEELEGGLAQALARGRRRRLHDAEVRAAHVGFDAHARFAVGEGADLHRQERQPRLTRDVVRELRMRVAGDESGGRHDSESRLSSAAPTAPSAPATTRRVSGSIAMRGGSHCPWIPD